MPTTEEEREKLWDWDFCNIAQLLQRVRYVRSIDAKSMATYCEVKPSTITRNIEERGGGGETLADYMDALRQKQINGGIPIFKPLKKKDTDILVDLHTNRNQVSKFNCDLAQIDFSTITKSTIPENLRKLLSLLRKEERPAYIIDPLWHVHAVNGAIFRLFDVHPKSPYLNNWEAWHTLATKFYKDSPVRLRHHDIVEFFPPSIDYFLKHEITYPYLFTWQMRNLIYRLHLLSNQNNYEFTDWWLDSISFTPSYELESTLRTIKYNYGKHEEYIQTQARINLSLEVELVEDCKVPFALAVWDCFGSSARKAYEHIFKNPASKTIYFAADYDLTGDFHVNQWPNVKRRIEQWTCE